MLFALAGLAVIVVGVVVAAGKLQKGKLEQKEVETCQDVAESVARDIAQRQGEKIKNGLVKFADGSYQNIDKNGILRIEKSGKAQKYYTADSKLLAEITEKGESILYDPKTGRKLMETNNDVVHKLFPSESYVKIYDKNDCIKVI